MWITDLCLRRSTTNHIARNELILSADPLQPILHRILPEIWGVQQQNSSWRDHISTPKSGDFEASQLVSCAPPSLASMSGIWWQSGNFFFHPNPTETLLQILIHFCTAMMYRILRMVSFIQDQSLEIHVIGHKQSSSKTNTPSARTTKFGLKSKVSRIFANWGSVFCYSQICCTNCGYM